MYRPDFWVGRVSRRKSLGSKEERKRAAREKPGAAMKLGDRAYRVKERLKSFKAKRR